MRLQVSIRLGLVTGITALVLLTAALIHVPWQVTARSHVSALALALNAQLIATVTGKMSALLEDAVATEQTLATAIERGALDLSEPSQRDPLLLAIMTNHPTLSGIEFAWLDDRAFAVQRVAGGALVTHDTRLTATGPARQSRRYALSDEGGWTSGAQEASAGGAPSTHQYWFKQAYEMPGASWSDIHRMANGALGFSVVRAVTQAGAPLGVLATSLELKRISAYLDDIETSPNAKVFLTNLYQELVAVQNEPSPMEGTGGGPIKKLGEAEAPLIKIAAEALAAQNVDLRALRGPRQMAFAMPDGRETYFVTVAPLTQMGLVVGLVVPESDILGEISRNTRRLGYALLGFIALMAAVVAFIATRTLARPLVAVTENTRRLGDFRFDEIRPVASRLTEIGALSRAVGQMSASLASFKKYIPTEVVRSLFAQGIEAELGGERRVLSIFFMDLADFTRLAEALGDALVPFLGDYLSAMSDEIRAKGGTIDKYIGDAIMAFWGAPAPNEQHALFACRAALACQTRLRQLRQGTIKARIGLNTGRVLVGNVGSHDRLNYTVIGDPVNVASRLESLNKRYGTEILIGEDTYAAAKDHVVARRLDRVAVYGKQQGVQVLELLALAEEATPALRHWVATWEEGIEALRARAWDDAEARFRRVIALREGTDEPSRLLIARIDDFRANPPPTDWDGLLILSEK